MAVIYSYPSTAPTAREGSSISMAVGAISMADSDTSQLFTHNLNVSAGDQTLGFPLAFWRYTVTPTTSVATLLTITVGTNIATITKTAATGSSLSAIITIMRPNTTTR